MSSAISFIQGQRLKVFEWRSLLCIFIYIYIYTTGVLDSYVAVNDLSSQQIICPQCTVCVHVCRGRKLRVFAGLKLFNKDGGFFVLPEIMEDLNLIPHVKGCVIGYEKNEKTADEMACPLPSKD